MHDIYYFVSGPMVWISFIVLIVGSLYRLINLIMLVNRKERFIFSYMSWKYSLRSILHWITPFATENWRRKPVLTIVTFSFHICLIIVPIFLLSHNILWDESWDIGWWSLPGSLADVLTVIVIGGCIFFVVRRLKSAEVHFVTSTSDYIILAIVAAPFVTGFFAYHQWFDYRVLTILHILAGELMIMAIPFTRLSHMLFSPLTRAYMGSEFGGIRHAKDW